MNIQIFEHGLHSWIIILLSLTIVVLCIKIFTAKKILMKAGKNYLLFETKKISRKYKLKIFIGLLLIIMLVLSIIVMRIDMIIMAILFFFIAILMNIIGQKYLHVKGIYENGIIDNVLELFEWKDVHSYNITGNNLFGYYKNGNMFENKNIEKIEEINELFKRKGIKNRIN